MPPPAPELLAPDLYLLPGRPRYAINAYLVGDVLLDTGTRWRAATLLRQLHGHTLSEVALTHAHPDHQGSARAICTARNVGLACPEADVPAMEGREPLPPRNLGIRLLSLLIAGASHPVTRVLRDGDHLAAGFHVVAAPGHTPGHIILFRDTDRVVIACDLAANMSFKSWKEGLREPPAIFSSDPHENRHSLHQLHDLKPTLICFGHGPPLRDMTQLSSFLQYLETRPLS